MDSSFTRVSIGVLVAVIYFQNIMVVPENEEKLVLNREIEWIMISYMILSSKYFDRLNILSTKPVGLYSS